MSSVVQVIWDNKDLLRNLENNKRKIDKELNLVLQFYAPQVENWMKNNAKWKDQTGNARNGLAARAFDEGDRKGIVMYHQVPYGIWLEVRWSGRYAVVVPAMAEWGPVVMNGVRNMLGRM